MTTYSKIKGQLKAIQAEVKECNKSNVEEDDGDEYPEGFDEDDDDELNNMGDTVCAPRIADVCIIFVGLGTWRPSIAYASSLDSIIKLVFCVTDFIREMDIM